MPPKGKSKPPKAAAGGKQRGVKGGAGAKREKRKEREDDDGDALDDSDDDARGAGGDEEGEEARRQHRAQPVQLSPDGCRPAVGAAAQDEAQDVETATEKRLRLAKAYLANLRHELAADAEGKKSALSDDEGEDDDDGARSPPHGPAAPALINSCAAAPAPRLRARAQRRAARFPALLVCRPPRPRSPAAGSLPPEARGLLSQRLQSDVAERRGEAQRQLAARHPLSPLPLR